MKGFVKWKYVTVTFSFLFFSFFFFTWFMFYSKELLHDFDSQIDNCIDLFLTNLNCSWNLLEKGEITIIFQRNFQLEYTWNCFFHVHKFSSFSRRNLRNFVFIFDHFVDLFLVSPLLPRPETKNGHTSWKMIVFKWLPCRKIRGTLEILSYLHINGSNHCTNSTLIE